MSVDYDVKRYHGLFEGTVINNVDPLGQHRVKIRIPNEMEETPWARPFGTTGGGSAQRGGWAVPEVGAAVFVMFVRGDGEYPVYACGGWPTPPAGPARPVPLRDDVPPTETHLVPTWQFCGGRLSIYIDERPGQQKLVVQMNPNGADADPNRIVFDLEQAGLEVKMDSAVIIRATGAAHFRGLSTTVGKRRVRPVKKPI